MKELPENACMVRILDLLRENLRIDYRLRYHARDGKPIWQIMEKDVVVSEYFSLSAAKQFARDTYIMESELQNAQI